MLRLAQRTSPEGVIALTGEVRAELDIPAASAAPSEAEIREALRLGESSPSTAKRRGLRSRVVRYRLMKKYGIEP